MLRSCCVLVALVCVVATFLFSLQSPPFDITENVRIESLAGRFGPATCALGADRHGTDNREELNGAGTRSYIVTIRRLLLRTANILAKLSSASAPRHWFVNSWGASGQFVRCEQRRS